MLATEGDDEDLPDAAVFDWYARDCPCGLLAGECLTHHRAYAEQCPPEGDWQTWFALGGRGGGKTRAGAEWVRWLAETGQAMRIALVAATAADARDVMVEGPSGILAICPPWNRPEYQPSRRQLTWPNGAIAKTFSADEPERLRGPQHAAAWCLVGDTPVLMADGSHKPIASVRPGDMVATRSGPRKVAASAMTRRESKVCRLVTLDGRVIIGTDDHEAYVVGRGFVPIGSIRAGEAVCVANASSGAAGGGIGTRAAITRARSSPRARGRPCDSTGRCGSPSTGRSLPDTTCTIRTTTRATTPSTTSSYSLAASTVGSGSPARSAWMASASDGREQRRCGGIRPKSVDSGLSFAPDVGASTGARLRGRAATVRADAWTRLVPAPSRLNRDPATGAAALIQRLAECSGIAPSDATRRLPQAERSAPWSARLPARAAGNPSIASGLMPDSAPGTVPWPSTDVVASVEELPTRYDVYDITVTGAGEFFAGGILVHNCDELGSWRRPDAWSNLNLGLRLGVKPRALITTTPKPSKLIRELIADPRTVVVRWSSHRNRRHLAPAFFDSIVAKYEGTRLGQQEIYAEVLEISEGVWFASFDPAKHMATAAEYDPRLPVHLAIDCGVSRHTAAVWFQVRPLSDYKSRVTVFGDYHAEGKFSEANATAIKAKGESLPCRGQAHTVRLDPAAKARTGIGPAAYGEFERVFGSGITSKWPSHYVTDGLDQIEILLETGCLLIHPRCETVKAAFLNYCRKQNASGDWLDDPEQVHPYEDTMDALRGGIRDRFPGGREQPTTLRSIPARKVF